MAYTIYFVDGTQEVLLHDRNDLEAEWDALECIIQERLGDDAADMFRAVTSAEEAGEDFELSCEQYRTCLQDVVEGLQNVVAALETPRSDRKKVVRNLHRLIKTINNEL